MRFILKLDFYSKLLCIIGLVGIVVSVFLLFNTSFQDNTGENRIAKISIYKNDIRLKRSENIHWFPISQAVDCYEDDLVFTGAESFATIEYPKGATIVLHPNSLVSLTKNKIAIEAGIIDVDLKQKTELKFESFGQDFEISEKASFKIVNKSNQKQIIPAKNSDQKAFGKIKRLNNFITKEEILLKLPKLGQLYPKHPSSIIPIEWSSKIRSQEFELQFYVNKALVKSLKTSINSVEISAQDFPLGTIEWKVKTKDDVSDLSHFTLTEKFMPELTTPEAGAGYELDSTLNTSIFFSWKNPLKLKTRVQVSEKSDFISPFYDKAESSSSFELTFKKSGQFFWRVGLEIADQTLWSPERSFVIDDRVGKLPLNILMNDLLDFALVEQFPVKINDPNNCESYQYEILNGEKVLTKFSSKANKFLIKKMKDGAYTLNIACYLKGKVRGLQSKQFKVKTSPPVPAPKLKVKSRKLFVWMKVIVDLLFPTAMSAEDTGRKLEWVSENSDISEIEISYNDPSNVILKQQQKDFFFIFKYGKLGKYFWRVRTKRGEIWGPFSEMNEIEISDIVLQIKGPLMLEPKDGRSIKRSLIQTDVKFKWKTFSREFDYFMEIGKTNSDKLRRFKVKGKSKSLSFKNNPGVSGTYKWRVEARSKFGNSSLDKSFSEFSILEPKPVPKESLGNTVLLLQTASAQYDIQITGGSSDLANAAASGAGMINTLKGEMKTRKGNYFASALSQFSSSDKTFSSIDLDLKLLKKKRDGKLITKYGYGGSLIFNKIDNEDLNAIGDLTAFFASAMYGINYSVNPRHKIGLNLEGRQLLALAFVVPSFIIEPYYNFSFSSNWSLRIFTNYESTKTLDADEIGFSRNIISYGLGIVGDF